MCAKRCCLAAFILSFDDSLGKVLKTKNNALKEIV